MLDIVGASSSVYRFRLASHPREISPMGGNFICVSGDKVICCGTASNLQATDPAWAAEVRPGQEISIYFRLNVSRQQRVNEHHDLLAGLPPGTISLPEAD